MPVLSSARWLFLASGAMLVVLLAIANGAIAQSGAGTVTGRVVWGPCLRGIPLPASPDAQTEPGAPTALQTPDAQVQPAPRPRPVPATGLPAGAVLVAVQNTSISARTDETGHFTLSGVPAGDYLTVAAGPVANESSATAARPNVLVTAGASTDIGTLSLGGQPLSGIACGFVPGIGAAPNAEPLPSSPDTAPPSDAVNP
jgi:hypothetical protein